MKKTFVTIFINNHDYDLVKDVGMIPYILGQAYGYESKLVCKEMSCRQEYLDAVVGLDIIQLNKKKIIWNVVKYIWAEGSNIDILNLYHFDLENLLWMLIYKIKNRHGKIYLKLDMDYEGLERYKENNIIKKIAKNSIITLADFVSAESSSIQKLFQKIVPWKKIYYIPDGFRYEKKAKEYEKENSIITVGRLGTKQKATEVLLDAFVLSYKKHDWNLKLIGEMTDECENIIKSIKDDHPELENRIQCLGYITDRKRLYDEYEKAKVFVLPSRWESFGIVLVEACACGCYLITTEKVPSAYDIIPNSSMGEIIEVDNVLELERALTNYINKNCKDCENKNKEEIISTFDWINIGKKIDDMLNG